MKHILRKYLSSRGSALFMVVSTMAALIVLVTAMYLSVLSSRSVQLTVFNQDQAYVSATAVTDIIQAYLKGEGKTKLSDALSDDAAFPVGSKLSTNGNGFEVFTGLDADAEETIFGAYDVTITRLNNEGSNWVYDIAVTVSNNGTLETTHALMIQPLDNNDVDVDETFAATGYIPNDVWIDSGTYNGALYFDAEYTRFGDLVGSGGGLSIKCEMRCAGSLVCDMITASPVHLDEPGMWIVGNNLYLESQPNIYDIGGRTTASGVEPGKIYVGGDMVIKDGTYYQFGNSETEPTDVYVVGDVYLCNINDFYGNLYVGGDLYFVGRGGNGDCSGKIYLSSGSHVYIDDGNGNYYNENDNYCVNAYDALHWDGKYYDNNSVFGVYNMKTDDTGKIVYTEKGADGKYTYGGIRGVGPEEIKEFMGTCGNWSTADAIKVLNDSLNSAPFNVLKPDTTAAMANEIDIHFKLNNGADTNYVYTISADCTIGDITAESTGSYQPTIVFDTGDAGDSLIVRLKENNYDFDGVGGNDCFSWMPDGGGHYAVNVITVGEGNLIIDVPAGVKYQAYFMDFVGHIAWFEHLGGTHGTEMIDGVAVEYFDRSHLDFCTTAGSIGTYFLDYIHKDTDCTDNCASSLQLTTDSMGKSFYTCPKHGGEYTEAKYNKIVASGVCPCNNRLEKTKTGFPSSNYGGKSQKANVNIIMVSSSESATIHFSGNGVMNNLFFGFIYAPYMTYMDEGSGGGLKNVGGLIVSDYIMRGAYSYVQCYPDVPIGSLRGVENDGYGGGDRSWRVYGV